jgi:hypothetical protein
MALGTSQLVTEISTRNLPGDKGRPARRADNLAASTSHNPTAIHGLLQGELLTAVISILKKQIFPHCLVVVATSALHSAGSGKIPAILAKICHVYQPLLANAATWSFHDSFRPRVS